VESDRFDRVLALLLFSLQPQQQPRGCRRQHRIIESHRRCRRMLNYSIVLYQLHSMRTSAREGIVAMLWPVKAVERPLREWMIWTIQNRRSQTGEAEVRTAWDQRRPGRGIKRRRVGEWKRRRRMRPTHPWKDLYTIRLVMIGGDSVSAGSATHDLLWKVYWTLSCTLGLFESSILTSNVFTCFRSSCCFG
jgi:hypothetical protein